MPLIPSTSDNFGTPVPSTEGYLTATPWGSQGGVRLAVDFRGIPSGAPDRVTVYRTSGDGTTVPVLGLSDYASPKAYTIGIDNTAPLGTVQTYQAVASSSTTGDTWTSGKINVPVPSGVPMLGWIKSTTYPALSLLCTVASWPSWSRAKPQGIQYANGATYPVVINGKRRAGTGTVVISSLTADERLRVLALLNSSGTLLLQAEAAYQGARPDVFVEAGQLAETPGDSSADPWRDWQFDVTEVDRPDPSRTRVTLPGHSFADVAARYGPLSAYPSPLIRLLSD